LDYSILKELKIIIIRHQETLSYYPHLSELQNVLDISVWTTYGLKLKCVWVHLIYRRLEHCTIWNRLTTINVNIDSQFEANLTIYINATQTQCLKSATNMVAFSHGYSNMCVIMLK
jgi:hypothetical protein